MDISNVSTLLAAVDRLSGQDNILCVGLDFTHTEYIDSAAVSALIQCKSLLEDKNKQFVLMHLSNQVRRVLEETRLIGLFPMISDQSSFWEGDIPPAPTLDSLPEG
jgi:anti-anti-sigma factor